MLNDLEKQSLRAQRHIAPVAQAVASALAALGANPAVASVDRGSAERFELQTRSAFAAAKALGIPAPEAAKRLAPLIDDALGWRGSASASMAPSKDNPGVASDTGFVNIALSDAFLLAGAGSAAPLFPSLPALRVLVDYSSPNCAKRMHVGHLRSTVIGDALCRLLAACGADVERVNHLGDWGTPFGVIIEQAGDEGADLAAMDLAAIEGIYQRGASRMSAAADAASPSRADGEAFAQRARATTAQMQRREQPAFGAWSAIRASTVDQLQQTYDLLGIGMSPADAVGESDYQDEAGPLLRGLVGRGLCVEGPQGVAFLGGKTPLPLEKSASAGGGLLYGGTDAAALARRGATGRSLLYVTDERQAGHFSALFELGAQAGWIERGQAVHVPFGMMLDRSGSPFKSRSGGAMPLSELVEDALEAARAATRSKAPDASDAQIEALARPLGIGALKYGDLSRNRTSAVKFDLASAVALEGDTAPYLQYARVRALSAARAGAALPPAKRDAALDPFERKLAWSLCRLRDAACDAVETLCPHLLCQAMFEAASAFGSFYEHCPCDLGGSHDPVRLDLMASFASRMGACLPALGLEALDAMPRPQKRPGTTP